MTCKDIKENPRKDPQVPISENAQSLPLDWPTLSVNEPYFDSEQNKYFIVAPTNFRDPGGPKLQERKDSAKPLAIQNLVRVFEKDLNTELNLSTLSESSKNLVLDLRRAGVTNNFDLMVQASEAENHIIPDRALVNCPGENPFGMVVLVSIRKDIFDLLQLDENAPLPIASNEVIVVSSELREKVNKVKKLFKKYENDAALSQRGNNIDFKKESRNLTRLTSALTKLINDNGYEVRDGEDDLIIVGLDKNSKPLYTLIDQGQDLIRLRNKFTEFATNKFVMSPTTMEIMLRLNELTRDSNKGIAWTNFTDNFDTVISPNFSPSLPSNCVSTIQSEKKKMDKNPFKSQEEKDKEDRKLNISFIADVDRCASELASQSRISAFDREFGFLDDVNTLDDAFNLFLNRNDFRCFAASAIECLMSNLPVEEVRQQLVASYVENVLDFEDFQHLIRQLGLSINSFQSLNKPLQDELMKCLMELPESEVEVLKQQLQQRAGVTINEPSDVRNFDSEKLVDGFGFRGKLALKDVYERNKEKVSKELLDQVPRQRIENANVSSLGAVTVGAAAMDAVSNIDVCRFPSQPRNPAFDFPDTFVTIDIMGAIFDGISDAILDALATALIQVVKSLLSNVIDFCSGNNNLDFDSVNVKDLLNADFQLPDRVLPTSREFLDATKNLLQALGQSAQINIGDVNVSQLGRNLSGLLDDLSAALTPNEISNLLNGRLNKETEKVIDCLVKNKYPDLEDLLGDSNKKSDVFENLGDLSDKEALNEQIAVADDFRDFKDICDRTDDPARQRLLEDRGLTPDDIENALNDNRKRKLNRIGDLARLIEDEDAFNKLLPPLLCRKNEDGSITPGLVPFAPPSFKFILDKTAGAIYDGVKMSFDREISSFRFAIDEKDKKNKKRRRVKKRKKYKGEDILNPEYARAIAQGVVGKDGDDVDNEPYNKDEKKNATAVIVEDEVIKSTNKKTFVATGLKEVFENIDTDENLVIIPKEEEFKMIFNVPNALDESNLTDDKVAEKLAAIESASFLKIDVDAIRKRLEDANAKDDHVVEYIVPPNQEPDEDNYKIRIKSGDQPAITISSEGQKISPEVQNFIQNSPAQLQSVADRKFPQIDRFNKFLGNTFQNGYNVFTDNSNPRNGFKLAGIAGTNTLDSLPPPQGEYFNILRFFFSLLGREIANSPLFESKVMALVDWLQLPLKQDGNPDFERLNSSACDPHLLDLRSIKKRMQQSLLDSICEDPAFPSADGLGTSSSNALEQAGIDGAVLTFIRLYCIDLVLKSVFVFSKFNINSENVDPMISEYYAEQIKIDIKRLFGDKRSLKFRRDKNKNFDVVFQEQSVIAYNNFVEKGFFEGEQTGDFNVALKGMISDQIPRVLERIIDIIRPPGSKNLNVTLTKIQEKMIREGLPLLDVADGRSVFETRKPRFVLSDREGLKTARFIAPTFASVESAANASGLLKDIKEREGAVRALKEFGSVSGVEEKIKELTTDLGLLNLRLRGGLGFLPLEGLEAAEVEEEIDKLESERNSLNLAIKPDRADLNQEDIDLDRAKLAYEKASQSEVEFDFNNGTFLLERYIRIEDVDRNVLLPPGRKTYTVGVTRLDDWQDFIDTNPGVDWPSLAQFQSWYYGLRLVYIPTPPSLVSEIPDPVKDPETRTISPESQKAIDAAIQEVGAAVAGTQIAKINAPAGSNLGGLEIKSPNAQAQRDKSFKISESAEVTREVDLGFVDFTLKETKSVTLNIVPLFAAEKEIELETLTETPNIIEGWGNNKENLINQFTSNDVYKFIFQYCMPLDRAVILDSILSSVYLSSLKDVRTLFDGTKQSLKQVFEGLLNGGDYTYEDDFVKNELGGNQGLNMQSNNTTNTDSSIPGISLPPIAARTPFLILKGLVELIDPNISVARRAVDSAKEKGKNIPIIASSLGLLPMNVFPPPPFGPGIGPPITPMGFAYLGLGIDSIFNDAKNLNNRRDQFNLDPTEPPPVDFAGSVNDFLQDCEGGEEE